MMNSTLFHPPGDLLGRFYTLPLVSELLVGMLDDAPIRALVDLGCGSGSLSGAARRRWRDADIVTVDLDKEAVPRFPTSLRDHAGGSHRHVVADALAWDLPARLGYDSGFDAAICNPPYVRVPWRTHFSALLEHTGLSGALSTIRDVTADVLFVAQNMRLLREGGRAGLIVPDGIATGRRYALLRQALVRRYDIECAIALPRGMFSGTDARAHILILGKRKPREEGICLMEFFADGTLSEALLVDEDQAVERMDRPYHAARLLPRKAAESRTLAELGAEIVRGTLSSSQARQSEFPVFHTGDFPLGVASLEYKVPRHLRLSKRQAAALDVPVAGPGDLLLARVDRNLERKVCLIVEGHVAISDCVFRLRVPGDTSRKIATFFRRASGRAWLAATARGTGARHISKLNLLGLHTGTLG